MLDIDIQYRLTGGATNTDPNLSLGGVISSTAVSTSLHGLWDEVLGDESAAGDVEYRCIGVMNVSATTDWLHVVAYILSQIAGGGDIRIGVEVPVNSEVQVIQNESTAPQGIVFYAPTDKASGLVISGEGDPAGTLGKNNKWCAIWLERTIQPSTLEKKNVTPVLRISGD